MSFVRVRPTEAGGPAAVRHPVHGGYVVPAASEMYDSEDPLVRAYPWLFVSDAVTEAPIEQATQAPGEKRQVKRR